jgi:hypothetical protein
VSAEKLQFVAEALGLLSSGALAWQSFRLVRHLRTVREVRDLATRRTATRIGELAEKGAEVLEKTVSRWDAADERLVVIGLFGLTGSFLLKLIALA